MGLAVANSAKHKLVRVLHHKLSPEGVHVAEVMVTGMVKGTPWDKGNATIEAADVGAKFWSAYQDRSSPTLRI